MLNPLAALLSPALKNNAFFSGGAVLMVLGGLLAYARALPMRAWHWVLNQCSVELDLSGMDTSYSWVLAWLNHQPYAHRSRRLSVQTTFDGNTVVFTPAQGQHFFRYRGRPVWVQRGEKERSGNNDHGFNAGRFNTRFETMHIRIVGRSQALARALIADAKRAHDALVKEELKIYYPDYNHWISTAVLKDRPLESVILPAGVLEHLLADIQRFLERSAWYGRRGIPYRRGYLLEGLPGTGKSSVVAALACFLQLPLHVLNIGSSTLTDDKLQGLFQNLPERCILLMEDVDATSRSVAAARTDDKDTLDTVTLSGLLNVLDGVGASEGRVLFMTTNHRDRLDPALIRPGRVDVEVHFDKANAEQVERLYRRFYDLTATEPVQVDHLADRFTMAELQGRFLQHQDTPEQALRLLSAA